MKHTLLRLVAWILVLSALLPVLAACSGGGEGTETTAPTQEQTDAPTDPTGSTQTESTDPTQTPPTDPTDPDPTETDPPATEPPATEPPETEPPATEPPATEPPATEPPAPDNDIGKEIAENEFAITVLDITQSDNRYIVTFTLTYTGEEVHSLNAKERIFVVNSDRRSIAADNIYDADGNSLLGGSIQKGQTLTIQAVFLLTDGFVPNVFRYVYDIMGFRRLQAEL